MGLLTPATGLLPFVDNPRSPPLLPDGRGGGGGEFSVLHKVDNIGIFVQLEISSKQLRV